MLHFANRAVVPGHVLLRQLDGESVLLNLNTEKYFGLDAMGTHMLLSVAGSPCIEAAFEKLLEEFEVEPRVLRTHLDELLGGLVDNGLLDVLPIDAETIPSV
jgi:Coenzyme PQQ synthesis protein D (PqqD)